MLKRMCNRLPWSHDAVSSVHHQPKPKTGILPAQPRINSALVLGDRNEKAPPAIWRLGPESSNDNT
jgi:hypothetical protein